MANIITLQKKVINKSFAELIAERERNKGRCLLLDTSGSMSGQPIRDLCKVASDFPTERKFSFNSTCRELRNEDIPGAGGGTAMAAAFSVIKLQGITHAVLVTDGGTTDGEENTLNAAQGLKLDIIFVGRGDPPDILAKLANQTGGKYGSADLSDTKELASTIKGLLA